MAADMFSKAEARRFLSKKKILIFGDSNMRGLYKDIVWLLTRETLMPTKCLKTKNEPSFVGDRRLSDGLLTSSRNYVEVREYDECCLIRFEFLTRLYLPNFVEFVRDLVVKPDFVVLNSCLWDLSRWGPDGIERYKENLRSTLRLLRRCCPNSTIVYTTALPPSANARGGFLTANVDFLKSILPYSIVEANNLAASYCKEFKIDLLDLYHHMRFMIDYRSEDGIHWQPIAVRYVTNLLLTHLNRSLSFTLPENISLSYHFTKMKPISRAVKFSAYTTYKKRKFSRKYDYYNHRNYGYFTDDLPHDRNNKNVQWF